MSEGLRTQGTHLYFVNTASGGDDLIKLFCPTGITGINAGARDQIEDTCLDNTADKTYVAGLGNPGVVTVPFNFKPSDFSHQVLFDLKESGDVIPWLVLFSESDDPPTVGSGGTMVPPATRSGIGFDGYVAEVGIDVATNEIVRGTLVIQRTGPSILYPYTPA